MDNKMILRNRTYKKINKGIKTDTTESGQSCSSENVEINLMEVPSAEERRSISALSPKHRKKRHKKSQSPVLSKRDHSTDLILALKKERFRPIRPKPLQPSFSVLGHKFELPVTNMTTLSPKTVFIPSLLSSTPIKKKIPYITPLNVTSNETNNYIGSNSNNKVNNINNSDVNNSNIVGSNIKIANSNTINDSDNINTVNIRPVVKKNKIVKTQNLNTVANSNCNNNNSSNSINNSSNSISNRDNNSNNNSKDMCNIKTTKSHKNSIELFFESMAQTVLNLPNEVQADIKMQICKIVTMAEIQYCELQIKPKTES